MPPVVKKCKEIDCMHTENASCSKDIKKSIVCVPKMPPVVKKCKEIDCADKRLHFGCGTFLFWNREALGRKSMEFLMDFGGSPVERYATNLGQSKSYAYDLFGGRFSTNPYSAYKRETAIYMCPKYVPYIFLCMVRNLFSQQ